MKKILLMVRAAPYNGIRAREALDAALLFSAFAPEMSVLFSGDGVWQLLRGQQPDGLPAKSVEATLGAFDAYEISQLFVDAEALVLRGVAVDQLLPGVRALDAVALRELIAAHDRVVTI